MKLVGPTGSRESVEVLARRIRVYLCQIAGSATPITYQALAQAMCLRPPNTIQQVAGALESLIEEDANAGRPLIAVFVVSKKGLGMPAAGFFDCAHRVGLIDGDHSTHTMSAFYAAEFDKAVKYWAQTSKFDKGAERRREPTL